MAKKTFDRVVAIAIEHLGFADGYIKPEHTFREDLGADSLDCVEMTMQFEDDFDISISDEEMNECKTVQDVVDLIDRIREG